MTALQVEAEIGEFAAAWARAMVEKDVETAARLRAADYRAVPGRGLTLTREDELAMISSPGWSVGRYDIANLVVVGDDRAAEAEFDVVLEGTFDDEPVSGRARGILVLRRSEDGWQAVERREQAIEAAPAPAAPRIGWAGRIKRRLRERLGVRDAGFPELAWLAYRPGQDFSLPPVRRLKGPADGLPVPPPELRLGHHFDVVGKALTRRMLEIVEASGFALRNGQRVLDLGCGAGRMIRHLVPFAERCEIWGADINAAQILWCSRHLSPPFHFVTTTKVPHLPFADGSVDFVYCGSLFTHIDDLARAWLLELRRLLSPEGRLYVTILDEHSLALLERGEGPPRLAQAVRASPARPAADRRFGMFAVGRDHRAQVFYGRDFFMAMTEPMFEPLSITEEAYFLQTALLLKPRPRA